MNAFDRIVGYHAEKEEMRRLCDALKQPEKYGMLGVRLPSALLLYGPPGVGKTTFAKALIEECGLPCFPCRKERPDGDFVLSIAETFALAVKSAPSIVFLDDMDKFAEDGAEQSGNKEEFAAVQSCMENVKGRGVFVLATANDVDSLPASLLRAGRFGRMIRFSAPTPEDAAGIIRRYLRGKPVSEDLSAETLARILRGETCATMEEIVNEAGLLAGYENAAVIGRAHLVRAILQVVFSIVPRDEPSDAARRSVCRHEAGHAVAALALGQSVGIVCAHGEGEIGGVCTARRAGGPAATFRDLMEDATIAMAGKAAVALRIGGADVSCRKDVDEAVECLRPALTRACAAGFAFGYDRESYDNRQAFGRVERISRKLFWIVGRCYRRARRILKRNGALLDAVAAELAERPALLADDLERLVAAFPLKREKRV